MGKIKMVVFDVDGTLYDLNNHEIPASAIKALDKLKQKGILIAIATGRTHYGLGKAINDLKPDYIIACSGGVVVSNEKTIIFREDFTNGEVNQIINYAQKHQAGLIFKFIDHMYIYNHPEKVDWLQGQLHSDIGTEPFIFHDTNHHLYDVPQSCSIHTDQKSLNQELKPLVNLDFLQFSQGAICGYDVCRKGTNKAKGITNLINHLKIDVSNVMVFGDNYNDLEMFELCPNSVAMGNAVEAIKKRASYITSSTNEDGIYNALKVLNII